jgi:cytochrome c oxidase assembly factor CtaG
MMLGLDPSFRGRVATGLRRIWPVVETLAKPAVAWAILVVTIAVWHVPALFDATLESEILHGMEHLWFFTAAILYWFSLTGLGRKSQIGYLPVLASVFGLALFGTALGALLTFANNPWFPEHAARASAAGRDWLADQQLAGVIMWLPGGVLLLATFLVVGRRWLGSLESAGRQP